MASRTLKTARRNAGTRMSAFNYSIGYGDTLALQPVIEFYDNDGRRNVISMDPSRITVLMEQLQQMKARFEMDQPEMLVHPMLRKA